MDPANDKSDGGPLQIWARSARDRPADGPRRRRRGRRPAADAGVAQRGLQAQHLQELALRQGRSASARASHRPAVDGGRQRQPRGRPGRPAGRPAADGGRVRGDRQRRRHRPPARRPPRRRPAGAHDPGDRPGGRAATSTSTRRGARTILDGLHEAATEPGGTSYPVFGDYPVQIAGKTGTAERPGQADQSWYIALAPYDDPKYVVAVTIERGGFGADSAAPGGAGRSSTRCCTSTQSKVRRADARATGASSELMEAFPRPRPRAFDQPRADADRARRLRPARPAPAVRGRRR